MRYVIVKDQLHELLFDLAKRTNLEPFHSSNQFGGMRYDIANQMENIPEAYYNLSASVSQFNSLDEKRKHKIFMNDYFDSSKVDVRCAQIKRIISRPKYGLLSLDLLMYGTGSLRRVSLRKLDDENALRTIHSHKATIYGKIIARTDTQIGSGKITPDIWESTNLIFGDQAGELRQIYDRRNEDGFMRLIFGTLRIAQTNKHPDINHRELFAAHRRWASSFDDGPISPRDISCRIELILNESEIDSTPKTKISNLSVPRLNKESKL